MYFFVTEESHHKEVRVQWARLSGVLRMNPVDSTTIPRPPSAKAHQNGDIGKVHEYCIVFTGFNLQEQALKDWLKTCCKPVCYIMEWHAIICLKTSHLTLPAAAAWKQLNLFCFFAYFSGAGERETKNAQGLVGQRNNGNQRE